MVSVDLRGHGRSDKPRQSYNIESSPDDLAWVCERLALARPVVVGHSMGGIVAFDLAARYPELPGAIVMLDTGVVLPEGARAAIPSMIERLSGPDYRNVQREYVADALFLASDSPDRRDRILDHMALPRSTWWSRRWRVCTPTTPRRWPPVASLPPSISPPTSPSRART